MVMITMAMTMIEMMSEMNPWPWSPKGESIKEWEWTMAKSRKTVKMKRYVSTITKEKQQKLKKETVVGLDKMH